MYGLAKEEVPRPDPVRGPVVLRDVLNFLVFTLFTECCIPHIHGDLVLRCLADTTIPHWPSPLYDEIVWYLHVTYAHSPVCIKSSLSTYNT